MAKSHHEHHVSDGFGSDKLEIVQNSLEYQKKISEQNNKEMVVSGIPNNWVWSGGRKSTEDHCFIREQSK